MKTHAQYLAQTSKLQYGRFTDTVGNLRQQHARIYNAETLIERPDEFPGAQIYTYTSRRGLFCAIYFIDGRSKPTDHVAYTTESRRDKAIEQFWADRAATAAYKAKRTERRAIARQVGHGLMVGDILHGSWGYEQTNNEFEEIIAVTPGTVTTRPLAVESRAVGYMSEMVRPIPGQYTGEPRRRRVYVDEFGCTVKHPYCYITKCDPTREYSETSYA